MIQSRFANIERILVRSANWVGDAIMTTPALHAIRKNFPHAHITLLAKPWVIPVFENSPDIDDIMMYEAQGRHNGLAGLWRLAMDIRKRQFDLAILFQNAFEAALLAFLAGIRHRVGFTTDGRTALLNHRVRSWRPLKRGHLVDYYLGLLAGAGLTLQGRQLKLFLTEAEMNVARRLIQQKVSATGRPLIGLNPGATFGTAKRWLPERYTKLGKRLISELEAQVFIFGGPKEADVGQQLAAAIGRECIDLSGQTTLRQAMALIGQCDLFITNDSGLMHVAAALNRPQIVVIGPTDPTATGPSNPNSRLVQVKEACHLSPCLKPHCPIIDHRCMTAISVDMVMSASLTLLKTSQEPA